MGEETEEMWKAFLEQMFSTWDHEEMAHMHLTVMSQAFEDTLND
jgi:hypothetical protein